VVPRFLENLCNPGVFHMLRTVKPRYIPIKLSLIGLVMEAIVVSVRYKLNFIMQTSFSLKVVP
jgi:hypothetical protein